MTVRPGAGHFGHTKACECAKCVDAKVAAFCERIEDRSNAVPKTGQSIPVRAHWRHNPHHLKKQAKVKAALAMALTRMRKNNA